GAGGGGVAGGAGSGRRGRRGRVGPGVPPVARPAARGRGDFALRLPDGGEVRLPAMARAVAASLLAMPSWRAPISRRERAALAPLLEHGIVAARDLPAVIIPDDPRALDGWRFA